MHGWRRVQHHWMGLMSGQLINDSDQSPALLLTTLVGNVKQSVASMLPSVHPLFPLCFLNRLIFKLFVYVWVMTVAHLVSRSGVRVKVEYWPDGCNSITFYCHVISCPVRALGPKYVSYFNVLLIHLLILVLYIQYVYYLCFLTFFASLFLIFLLPYLSVTFRNRTAFSRPDIIGGNQTWFVCMFI